MLSSQCLCWSVASYLLPIVVASFVFYFSSNISVCLSVSVSSADFNIKSPSSNPTCKNYQHQVGLCHPPVHAKTTKRIVCHWETQSRSWSRWGLPLFLSCLLLLLFCCTEQIWCPVTVWTYQFLDVLASSC